MTNGLRALREQRGWTLEQAADAMGLSYGGYEKIERGERKLSQHRIARARAVYQASADEVTGDASIQQRPSVSAPAPAPSPTAILVPLLLGSYLEFGIEPGLASQLASSVIASAYNPTSLRSPPSTEDLIETGRNLVRLFAPKSAR